MALVKFGGGITAMSGSIAGNTFARNRYGAYVRSRTKPVNPQTPGQEKVRAAMAFLVERWAETLTGVQRAAWNLYASNVVMKNKLGENIHLSGFNHYVRSNVYLAKAPYATIDDGPVVFELPGHDPIFAIVVDEAGQEISVTYDDTMDWANENNAKMELNQGSPQNTQRSFFDGPWRTVGNIPGALGAPPASPQVKAVTFAVAEGQHQWCFARIRRADGRLSTPFRADVIVIA